MKLAAALLLSVSLYAQNGTPAAAFDKAAFGRYLRYLEVFLAPVEVQIADPKPSALLPGFSEVAVHFAYEGGGRDERYYVSADGKTFIKSEPGVIPAYHLERDPFQANREKLRLENQPSFGPAEAPVTIVEFGDFECPSCRAEAPILRKLLPGTFPDQVRVVFKDYPLESIHPWARSAAVAGRCVFRQDHSAFWKFYDFMYETQERITQPGLKKDVTDWAVNHGLDSAALEKCLEDPSADAEVARNIEDGRVLGVRGTPSLFINGRKIGGIDWRAMQRLVEMALEYQKSKGRITSK